jgi:hypothetical protein
MSVLTHPDGYRSLLLKQFQPLSNRHKGSPSAAEWPADLLLGRERVIDHPCVRQAA